MAEMQTLHLLSQNTLHMGLVKGCFCIFLYKASFVFVLVGMGLILVSLTLLSTGSNPLKPEYKMKLLATFIYSAPYSIICPSF